MLYTAFQLVAQFSDGFTGKYFFGRFNGRLLLNVGRNAFSFFFLFLFFKLSHWFLIQRFREAFFSYAWAQVQKKKIYPINSIRLLDNSVIRA